MKQYFTLMAICSIALFACNDQYSKNKAERERTIKEYFSGWEKKDWRIIAKNLDGAFTFTSPNDDDHLPIGKFKEKCWVQADHILRFNFLQFADTETGTYVTYQLFTKDNSSFRNTEYFDFAGDKIKSIEVFFGAGEGSEGFPTNKK